MQGLGTSVPSIRQMQMSRARDITNGRWLNRGRCRGIAHGRPVSAKRGRWRLWLPARSARGSAGRARVPAPDEVPQERAQDNRAKGNEKCQDLVNPVHRRSWSNLNGVGHRKTAAVALPSCCVNKQGRHRFRKSQGSFATFSTARLLTINECGSRLLRRVIGVILKHISYGSFRLGCNLNVHRDIHVARRV